jgi:hypothetical protein
MEAHRDCSGFPDLPTWRSRIPHRNARKHTTQQPKGQQVSTPKTISIDGTDYIRASDMPAGPPSEYRIVVADRGWVFVGPTVDEADGGVTISPARCIRVWGTDESKPGLGYLALNGPTDKTKLDPSGTVRIPQHAVVASFDARESAWA